MTNVNEATSTDVLLERLKHYDEVILLELLDIDSEDLLEKFRDRVLAKVDYLKRELEMLNEINDEGEQEEWNYEDELDLVRLDESDEEEPNGEE